MGWILCVLVLSCAPDKPEVDEGTIRIGALMMENGRRFETAGRAANAGRWELAEYEVHEILELFEVDMPHAPLPADCDDEQADRMFENLSSRELPVLRSAARERNIARFEGAYRTAAASCNGCHSACEVAFVEVPTQPGALVPSLEPVSVAAPPP
jgi:hypothetical protein